MTSSTTNYAPGAQLPYQLSRTVYVCRTVTYLPPAVCHKGQQYPATSSDLASTYRGRRVRSGQAAVAAGTVRTVGRCRPPGQVRSLSPQALSVPWDADGRRVRSGRCPYRGPLPGPLPLM